MRNRNRIWITLVVLLGLALSMNTANAGKQDKLDQKVKKFLETHKSEWRDLNVPFEDGQVLHDLIVKNGYKDALEIGTSTGHSSIWIAWALSKTGGKLTTVEIDPVRHKQALANFKEAGLDKHIDAHLADAHQLVKDLKGPFDFVFSDADKDWYIQYFKDVHPKLKKGGMYTAHNVTMRNKAIKEFVEFVKAHPGYKTTIDSTSRSGISISRKK